jgi:hypothetical protein
MPRAVALCSVLAAAVLVLGYAGPAAAVEPIIGTPIPDEPPSVVLPLPVASALAIDLDHDGVRELLTIGSADRDPNVLALQAWWIAADGSVEASNQVPLRHPDRQVVSSFLFVADRDGLPVPMVGATADPEFPSDPTHLTIWDIDAGEGALSIRMVADTQGGGSGRTTAVADMDADGTDELLVGEGDRGATLELGLLRWSGDRYTRIGLAIPRISAANARILDTGDTDGVAGEEALLTGPSTLGPDGLYRVSLRDGEPFIDVTRGDVVDAFDGPFGDARAFGQFIAVQGGFPALKIWTWPRDAEPALEASLETPGGLMATWGRERDLRLAFVGQPSWDGERLVDYGQVVVLGVPDHGEFSTTTLEADPRAAAYLVRVAAYLFAFPEPSIPDPYIGLVAAGVPGEPDALVFGGQLITPEFDSAVLASARPMALLPGLTPIGTVGPDGVWTAVLPRENFDLAELRLVSTESLLTPEVADAHLFPTLHGVLQDPESSADLRLGTEAAHAEIEGPPGTSVSWAIIGGSTGRELIGPSGSVRFALGDGAASEHPPGSTALAGIWAVTPAGHGYSGAWRLHYGGPPTLDIDAPDALLDFGPAITGRTVPGATVTADGSPVTVAADGSFEASVPMGLLPADVRVVVVDPVGNRAERTVSVLWPLDYRRLPFVPLVVLLTVVAGLVLYLRRPDTHPSRRPPDDGATFEEIGG